MASRKVFLPFLLMVAPVVASQCSDAWKNCSESMCCATPFFQCIEKNPGGKKYGGEMAPAYAQCRNGSKPDVCPCDAKDGPCIDFHDDYKAKVKIPWTCIQLTGGCSKQFQACGPGFKQGKDYPSWKAINENWAQASNNKPCCQWGCTCEYEKPNTTFGTGGNGSWEVMCKPPKGSGTCKADSDEIDYGDVRRFALTDAGEAVAPTPQRSPLVWLAGISCASLLVSSVVLVLRKRRNQNLRYAEAAPADAEALNE